MLAKIIPVIALAAGVGIGVGAGVFLEQKSPISTDKSAEHSATPKQDHQEEGQGDTEFVKLNNQFVIPIIGKDRVESLVVLSLSLEVEPGMREAVYAHEPKLRDAFLRALFDHANMGGFQGEFTRAERLRPLRIALNEVAQAELGSGVRGVLITGIARQDS